MTKVLFCINNMDMGGIQKSLVELLTQVHDLYDITLFCIKPEGELLCELPSDINIVYASDVLKSSEFSTKEAFQQSFLCGIARIFGTVWSKLFSKRLPAYLATKVFEKSLGTFDVAISYSQPIEEHKFFMLSNEVIFNTCKAKQKISFLHCDFTSYGGNTEYNRKMYLKFDRVAAVSNSVKERFLQVVPQMKDKLFTVYNCHNYEDIVKQAQENPVVYDNTAIVTVARLTEEKGLFRGISAIKKLVEEDHMDISWHIIGDGFLKNRLLFAIQEAGMNHHIFLHGAQLNPYRFMQNASLLLVPSFHEAAPMVFEEAHALHLPILSTQTLSAKELVEQTSIGWVCANEDDALYLALKQCIENCETKRFQLEKIPVSNQLQISQFNNLIKE